MSSQKDDDKAFHKFIKTFRTYFGIKDEAHLQTQDYELIAEHVQLDALVVFPETFDFTSLRDCIFPFLGIYDAFEYKGLRDPLLAAHFYQYSFTELGLIGARFLSKERTDRKGWNPLSFRAARIRSEQIKAQGASHTCCQVILSTADPRLLRKGLGFEPVTDYPHLNNALYRLIMSENEFVGSLATYLVLLNKLPVCAKNAPLLLLSTGQKKIEFCKWLIEKHEGVTLEEKVVFQFFLVDNHLVENEEVEKEMKKNLFGQPRNRSWIFEEINTKPEEEQEEFRQLFYQKMLNASSRQEVVQRVMGANSPIEVAQKALGAGSPIEVAQKALGAGSPVEMAQKALEAALNSVQTPEQRRELSALLSQMTPQMAQAASPQPSA